MKGLVLRAAVAVCCALAVLLVVLAEAAGGMAAPRAAAAVAPGGPGVESYYDLARKDCVGTAANTRSKAWFTVADGVLSDVYWPTVDATNVHTLEYLVTDGRTFTDLQERDMTYSVLPDPTGMSCRVIASDSAHGYSITTTYVADPARNAVLMHVSFSGPSGDSLYVRLDPLAGGTGGGGTDNAGGNSAVVTSVAGRPVPVDENTNTATAAVNRSYAVPTYEALESSSGFSSASVGYAGTTSDGLSELDASHALTPVYGSAPNGHVALTAGMLLPPDRSVDLALGFGQSERRALSVAGAAVRQNFDAVWSRYERGWLGYDAGLRRPSSKLSVAAVHEYYESVNVVKASEDKTFPGAIAAGLASPWGQSVPAGTLMNGKAPYFGSYREVFSRDLYEAATGLFAAGDVRTAQDADLFLFRRQQLSNGSMPRNSLENGQAAPDTGGLQLDETSYPILMDWQFGLARHRALYKNHVIPAADFLVANGPSDGLERWEEQGGYSPSTIAAEIAGLTAASAIASANGDSAHARLYQAVADDFARNIKKWTVTSTGPDSSSPYFIRLSKTGDPNAAITYSLGNGDTAAVDQRSVIDAGFLELVRLGVLPANDPDVVNSLSVVDNTIERSTLSGVGFYRYGYDSTKSSDGYGDCYQPSDSNCSVVGAPWAPTGTGTGHLWPVLSGERGEYEVAAGDSGCGSLCASSLLASMRNMTSGQGLEPEQAWEDPAVGASRYGTSPLTASIGFVNGKPAGSASPLTWAQAQYARLTLDLSAGRDLDTPSIVSNRYVRNGMPSALALTITSPASGTSVDSSNVNVAGTTVPGARVDVEAVGATGGTAAFASATADSSGSWLVSVPVGFGSTTITATATAPGGRSTGYAQSSVTNVALPGTKVFSASDATGDDNGPGTYQYPAGLGFPAGTFDLTSMQVNQDGSDVYIQFHIANLTAIFGSSFGAQLLDLYVRNPTATGGFSTAAAYPQLNYSIASGDAWSERLEAQGFASPIWENASGTSLGTPQFVADDASGTATLILPQQTFGTVDSGWVFAVALTGQNGFNSYQARDFSPTSVANTSSANNFGVCAPGGTAPICSFPAGSVPKVMDTIPPSGVLQDTELDPTLGPVELQGVSVPPS